MNCICVWEARFLPGIVARQVVRLVPVLVEHLYNGP